MYCQTINGKESFRPGEAKNSWLTGTAAWNFYAVSQAVLGVKPQFDGLMIDPCLPSHLTEVKIGRTFRGNRYEITILNRSEAARRATCASPLTGRPVAGRTVPRNGGNPARYSRWR